MAGNPRNLWRWKVQHNTYVWGPGEWWWPFYESRVPKGQDCTPARQAAGPDSIPQEVMKNCATDDIMLEICNAALTNNHSPSQWTLPQIITLPKKGDLSMPYNYRGIGLMCFVAKLFSMILLRLRNALEPKLRCNQNEFRPERTTISQILALWLLKVEASTEQPVSCSHIHRFPEGIRLSQQTEEDTDSGSIQNITQPAEHSIRATVLTPDGETFWQESNRETL